MRIQLNTPHQEMSISSKPMKVSGFQTRPFSTDKSSVQRACLDFLAAERRVQLALSQVRRGGVISPVRLLEIQTAIQENQLRVEFLSRCVQSAMQTLSQLQRQ